MWFLRSSDGLGLVGVKELVLITRKSVHLGVFFPNIQQGQLRTGRVSPSHSWSEWCTVWVNFSRDVVMSFDTCNTVVMAIAHPCRMLSVPASYSRMRCGLLAVIVQQTCSASSFAITDRRVVQGLVNQLLLWSAILSGSLKLAPDGLLETPISNPIQHGRELIGPKSLRAECSATKLGRPSLKEGYSDRAASLVQAAPQRRFCITPAASHVLLPDQLGKFVANREYATHIFWG